MNRDVEISRFFLQNYALARIEVDDEKKSGNIFEASETRLGCTLFEFATTCGSVLSSPLNDDARNQRPIAIAFDAAISCA